MPVSEQELWSLAVAGRLFSAAARDRLTAKYATRRKGAGESAVELAHWLVKKRVISPYQAKVLLAGRPGPFVFGKYLAIDRLRSGPFKGFVRAIHRPTHCPVLLDVLKSPRPGGRRWWQLSTEIAARRDRTETRLVRIYELAHKAPYAFAALESLHGESAAERAAAGMAVSDAYAYVREAALGLAELHEERKTFGPVAPADLWIDRTLGPRLIYLPWKAPAASSPVADVRGLAVLLRALLPSGHQSPEGERLLQWLAPSNPAATPTAREAAAALLPLSSQLAPAQPQRSRRRAAYLTWLRERPGHAERSSANIARAAKAAAQPVVHEPPDEIVPSMSSEELASDFQLPPSAALRKRIRPQRSPAAPLAAAAMVVILAAVVGVIAMSSRSNEPAPSVSAPAKASDGAAASGLASESPSPPPAADDGKTLWASPTAGEPLDLQLLASGAQLLLAVRPAELAADEEGQRLLGSAETMGFDGEGWLENATGLPVTELESVLLAVYPREAGEFDWSLVVRTLRPTPDLPQRWPGAQLNPVDAGKIYQTDARSYFVPAGGERLFAVGKLDTIREIATASGPPVLRRELEALLEQADRDRQVTLVVAPAYFFSAGQSVFFGAASGLATPLHQFLGDRLSALALSVHLHEGNLFLELRAAGQASVRAKALADQLLANLQKLPAEVKTATRSTNLSAYSRDVLLDLPRMIEELAAFTRADVEQGQAVLRAYLPARAAHNLALGGGLLALETGTSASSPAPAAATAPALSLDESLRKSITLSFPRESLETALQQWGDAAGVTIAIQGGDLEAESITKNQSFGINELDQPAGGVLRRILLLASPEGKLVYVERAAAAGGSPSLVVTTRAAAARRGDAIPAEFPAAPQPPR
jgi:hypothetical protein